MLGEANLHVGDRIAGRFVLEGAMGAGGSGEVWRARDEQLSRTVALKVLRQASCDDERRLRREARALAALTHPNIVAVHDVLDGPPAMLVLEYVAGRPLRALLDERQVRVDEVRTLARALASALNAAHQAGVVHGDVKPDNIVVDDTLQRICLIDFGLAAPIVDAGIALGGGVVDATRTLSIRGTPGYLAPEALDPGGRDGSAADRYALGVVLLECLVGDNVFRAPTTAQTLARHAERPPPDPRQSRAPGEVDDALADVVLGLLAKDPALRPSWATMQARLAAPPTMPARPVSPVVAHRSWPRAVGAAIAVAAAVGGVVVSLSAETPRAPVAATPAVHTVEPAPGLAAVTAPQHDAPRHEAAPHEQPASPERERGPVAKQNPRQAPAVAIPAVEKAAAELATDAAPAASGGVRVPPPAGLAGKRAWLTAHCSPISTEQTACAALGSARVPDDLVDLQRYRAEVDACIRRCGEP